MLFPFVLSLFILPINIFRTVLAQPPWLTGDGSSDCGQGCFFQNLRNSGCQFPNIGCVCETQGFIPDLTTCVNGRCNATEAEQVLLAASSLCASVGASSSTQVSTASGSTSTQTSTSQVSTRSDTSRSTFTTSTSRPNTLSDNRSTSSNSRTRSSTASATAPPSETQSESPPTTDGGSTPIGAIVGGVVGGFGGVSLILAMVWLIMREKNKGDTIRALPPLMPKPHTDPIELEDQPLPIWDGQQVFTWNPRTNSATELPATEIVRQELPGS
ncbi:hypothetical protein TWF225_010118 [Orbilia oligospora]|uniref:CFEM domain-containing protein n=1 Tax=Orbilia oligospora TaxID=2813651 RepID=A0A7C8PT28_ORBOL|nr:hypothetical protein TWF751_001486 [Orbilia oligospora]KAF3193359.1 hypothetical protein TWF225_010118 [Orbilia oligospora]KAF3241343.1 hypothetical protein TWF128_011057 [Orbilia oligospora]KAF3244300.1 hypothetical protein TWF217_010801 [Orbilia oligospora]KAF3296334.1 hypothetical protein TWF132_010932 [Orbilia oligospora]